jgi:hypothetical protein
MTSQSSRGLRPYGSRSVAALNRDSARLDRAESKFISYMFNKLTSDPAYVPTVPQVKWILHISAKLGRDLP